MRVGIASQRRVPIISAMSMPGLGLRERLALRLGLLPRAAAEAVFPMMAARTLMAGHRLGFFAELAAGEATAEALAGRRGLCVEGTRRLLDALAALGHVRHRRGRYALARSARRWLDPRAPGSIGPLLEFNYLQWEWWSELEAVIGGADRAAIHERSADDPFWQTYLSAMLRLARLSAPEVARALSLPREARRILDLAGGHGWFAAELVRRHPRLTATVLDLPGAVRAGRRILAEAAGSLAERVELREGDLRHADLGGPWDAVLVFQVVHHLGRDEAAALFGRVRGALAPGGRIAVLDTFAGEAPRGAEALLGLHFFLTSASGTVDLDDLRAWLLSAGFERPRVRRLRRLPVQTLVTATTGGAPPRR